ncbi:hypothetical protein [Mycobacterium sp.]|uniref:hypothetical protein n=1 Tax=Mycobacterium sp. TaxID=1785 RepID=UPI002BD41732|nr:hypothetical protein [Mycobacterium sp.]HKP41792.1 hypothetical protein [Mycobacterium sp.]
MQRRKLVSGSSTGDAPAFETQNFQPGSNTLVLLFVTSARPIFGDQVARTPTVTGNGLVWVTAKTVLYGPNDNRRLTCFRASGPAPIAGAAVIDFGGEIQDFCAWSIFEYSDVDVSVGQGQSAVAQIFSIVATGQSLTASLATSADPTRNFAVGAIGVDSAGGGAVAVEPGAGFTEIDELDVTEVFAKAGTLQTEDAAASNSAISWTWDSAQAAAAVVLEVKAAPPSGGEPGGGGGAQPTTDDTLTLIENFAPVLFFHPEEKFFPSDAKRYVEHAALWTAQAGGDDKNAWGGQPGDPFPRQPTVTAKGLAAVPGEPGDFRFGEELGAGNDFRFLELGGWKDRNLAHEDGVTGQTTNLYSDRNAIENLYKNDLEPSRFWYHAEVFYTEQLRTIGRSTSGVDLSPLLDRLTKPTLVCYYLFFPAHDQSVQKDSCRNVEAGEVSSHAGDWQCVAVLGEGIGAAFSPKFLGRTGSRPGGGGPYPPYQFDDDMNTAMVVGSWTDGDPSVTDGHPRLFVANGTHSLYTKSGTQSVDPYPPSQQPQWCGTVDVPTPTPPSEPGDDPIVSAGKDTLTLLAKMVAGGAFGFLGASAALVACVVEAAHYHPGRAFAPFGGESNPNSPADPDQPPGSAGAGKTVKPTGLNVPDAGSDVVEWRCKPREPLQDGARAYNCVVDRTTQKWWPSADTKSGFNGRWGQHVTADALSRRAGPRFPNYARMFLLALADGDGRKLLKIGG